MLEKQHNNSKIEERRNKNKRHQYKFLFQKKLVKLKKKNNRKKHHPEKADPRVIPALRWQEEGRRWRAAACRRGTCRGLGAAS